MKIVFRVDASQDMGTGHVMRCLALADAFNSKEAECLFISRLHEGNLHDLIRQRGYEVLELQVSDPKNDYCATDSNSALNHAAWLGCHWELDARQSLRYLEKIRPNILVVDHYAIDARWEKLLRQTCDCLLVIDDLADRSHICDFLVDQNWFGVETQRRYLGLLPDKCVTMLGPEFALLKSEYPLLRKFLPPRNGDVRRLLVFLGGSDPTNETGKVLDALSASELSHLAVDVVIGVNHPNSEDVIHKATARPSTYVYSALPSLAGWMMRADLMISAGGSTTWERMCLGLPAIVVSTAHNQTETNIAMHAAGYVDFLGPCSQVSTATITQAVIRCLDNPNRLRIMSHKAQELVSGTGAERTVSLVLAYRH